MMLSATTVKEAFRVSAGELVIFEKHSVEQKSQRTGPCSFLPADRKPARLRMVKKSLGTTGDVALRVKGRGQFLTVTTLVRAEQWRRSTQARVQCPAPRGTWREATLCR